MPTFCFPTLIILITVFNFLSLTSQNISSSHASKGAHILKQLPQLITLFSYHQCFSLDSKYASTACNMTSCSHIYNQFFYCVQGPSNHPVIPCYSLITWYFSDSSCLSCTLMFPSYILLLLSPCLSDIIHTYIIHLQLLHFGNLIYYHSFP